VWIKICFDAAADCIWKRLFWNLGQSQERAWGLKTKWKNWKKCRLVKGKGKRFDEAAWATSGTIRIKEVRAGQDVV
jgi:hypothetical protein